MPNILTQIFRIRVIFVPEDHAKMISKEVDNNEASYDDERANRIID